MIQDQVDKVVKFIEEQNYFHAPYLDYVGIYSLGDKWERFDKGEKVILIKAYNQGQTYYIINRVEGAVRMGYIQTGKEQPILIPENLKFYLGGLND